LIQKIKKLRFLIYFLLVSALFSQDEKVKVIAEEAVIYAQASEHSIQIDTVKKGTILTLFKPGQPGETWYYVHYRSENWNAKVSGFIHTSKVEHFTEVPKEEPAPVESKVPPVTKTFQIEEISGETPIPSNRIIVLPAPTGVELQSEIFKPAITESPAAPLFPEKPAIPVAKPEKPVQIPAIETPKISTAKISPQKQEIQVEKRIGEIPVPPARILVFPQVTKSESRSQIFLSAPKIKPKPPPPPPVIEKKPTPPPEKIEKPKIQKLEPQIQRPPQLLKPKIPEKKFQLLTISLGYGSTTGGIGGSIQMNTRSGLSFHAGIGYYPAKIIFSGHNWITNKMFFSGGIKYYLPLKSQRFRSYLDLQYGGIKVEAVQVILGIWNHEYLIENHQKALWGPSLLAGAEFKFGSLGINAALGLAYNTTSWELWDENLIVTGDVSLLLYF
jgi:hypothetical protein